MSAWKQRVCVFLMHQVWVIAQSFNSKELAHFITSAQVLMSPIYRFSTFINIGSTKKEISAVLHTYFIYFFHKKKLQLP